MVEISFNEYQNSTFMIHDSIEMFVGAINLPKGLRGLTIGLEILKTKQVPVNVGLVQTQSCQLSYVIKIAAKEKGGIGCLEI